MAVTIDILARSRESHARLGRVATPHGAFDTPAFMPVGTLATVKGLLPQLVAAVGSQVVLANTYHLMLRPGSELIARRGGLHPFMGWPGPILTDSGGYQAFSLSDTARITDDGFAFRSIIDGASVHLSPESAMSIQADLGADIIMALDDCPPSMPEDGDVAQHARRLDAALDRTARWLERCKASQRTPDRQALFGIVQGGTDLDRRSRSVEQVCSIDLPGYAIGGVAVGEGHAEIASVVAHTAPLMPEGKPRYLMGVGYERDLLAAVRAGVDMFDCVLPTRNGRNANAFTSTGQVRLKNARFAEDDGPIDPACDCPACRPERHGWPMPGGGPFSRAYLRHLFQAGEMLGPILVSLHNVRHFQRLMVDIRAAIRDDAWSSLRRAWPVLDQPRDDVLETDSA